MNDSLSEEREGEIHPKSKNEQNLKELPFPYFLSILQLTLRVLGTYIFLVGTTYGIEGAVVLLSEWTHTYDIYYIFRTAPFSIGRFIGNVAYAVAGLYFILGGKWVIENVFLPSSRDKHPLLDELHE